MTAVVGSAGDYYVKVDPGYGIQSGDTYTLTASTAVTSVNSETEPNDSLSSADELSSGVEITGQSSDYNEP